MIRITITILMPLAIMSIELSLICLDSLLVTVQKPIPGPEVRSCIAYRAFWS